jgi:hypothetical protein
MRFNGRGARRNPPNIHDPKGFDLSQGPGAPFAGFETETGLWPEPRTLFGKGETQRRRRSFYQGSAAECTERRVRRLFAIALVSRAIPLPKRDAFRQEALRQEV